MSDTTRRDTSSVSTVASAGGVRQARAEQTRADIIEAAHRLFVENGYRATSLREVAAAAGLSHSGLQRHFPTKDGLLVAVVDSFRRHTDNQLDYALQEEAGTFDFAAIARLNAEVPGYLPLYAALTGEASTSTHPAHAQLRDRYQALVSLATDHIEDAIKHDIVDSGRDPHDEAIRGIAAWDGLQLIAQYLPDRVDIEAALDRHQDLLALPRAWRDPSDPAPRQDPAPLPPVPDLGGGHSERIVGYRSGRETRERIVAGATALFAREGFGDTSLSTIAQVVGVTKATLLHHYTSKEALLEAVLVERDRTLFSQIPYTPASRAAHELRGMPIGARVNAERAPGLIQVYAVLSCEAVPAEHPAHDYFTRRYATSIDHFAALLRAAAADGDLPSHRDPEAEAIWLAALWEGLQYQWLYDSTSVDVATHLAAHLDDLLP